MSIIEKGLGVEAGLSTTLQLPSPTLLKKISPGNIFTGSNSKQAVSQLLFDRIRSQTQRGNSGHAVFL
jgi:hypothetical protein